MPGDPEPDRTMPAPWRSGRGSAADPPNRFAAQAQRWDGDCDPADEPDPATEFLDDATRGILSRNDSPDVPFTYGLNPYRGCEHGCSYCYARAYHEHLGMSAGLDFERRIMVKRAAPALLRAALAAPGWTPQVVAMSGATDCYQPVERRLRLTRGCLEVFAAFRNPVALITKNALIARDLDHLSELAKHRAVSVAISLTTLRPDLARRLEPRASDPSARLAAIRALAAAGIPVGVNVAPVIPGLTDYELPAILGAAAAAGAAHAGWQSVRLPPGVDGVFAAWLRHHEPHQADKVLRAIAAGDGARSDGTARMFAITSRRVGLSTAWPELDAAGFMPPHGRQLTIFES